MAEVELGTALVAYAEFFPPGAPAPGLDLFVRRWQERIAAGGRTAAFCAVDDSGQIVGTACGFPDPDDADQGYFASLYVRPEVWGRGIGRTLHDEVLGHLARTGFATATLWVIAQNVRSRSMYERWGWQPTRDRQEAFPGSGVVEVRYTRAITASSQPVVA